MREKLLLLMKNEGLTSSRLAELLGIRPSGISHILSGRNNPSFELVQKILRRFPTVNPDWLLLDTGEMYRQESSAAQTDTIEIGSSETLTSEAYAQTTMFGSTENSTAERNSQIASAPTEHQALAEAMSKPRGRVKRVIVLYDDHTFESYEISR